MKIIMCLSQKGSELQIIDLSDNYKKRKHYVDGKAISVNIFVLLIAMIMLMNFFTPLVDAEGEEDEDHYEGIDDDGDEIDDGTEDFYERSLKIEYDSHEMEISLTSKSEDYPDELEFHLRTWDEIEIEMHYNKDSKSVGIDLELELKFSELIEFEDSNENGVYDATDTVVSTYDLEDSEYDDITYVTKNTIDNEIEHVISVESSDGVFKIVCHVTGTFAQLDSGMISPSEVKIDLIIDNYAFENDNTKLALQIGIETEAETETDHETFDEEKGLTSNEEEIEIFSDDVMVFFSWNKKAVIDGVEMPVDVTISTDSEGDTNIYFVYPNGQEIVHDPKLGFPYKRTAPDSNESSGVVAYMSALFIGTGVVGFTVFWRRKKNGLR